MPAPFVLLFAGHATYRLRAEVAVEEWEKWGIPVERRAITVEVSERLFVVEEIRQLPQVFEVAIADGQIWTLFDVYKAVRRAGSAAEAPALDLTQISDTEATDRLKSMRAAAEAGRRPTSALILLTPDTAKEAESLTYSSGVPAWHASATEASLFGIPVSVQPRQTKGEADRETPDAAAPPTRGTGEVKS